MFLTKEENNLSKEFFEKGYIIRPAQNINALSEIRNNLIKKITNYLKIKKNVDPNNFSMPVGGLSGLPVLKRTIAMVKLFSNFSF